MTESNNRTSLPMSPNRHGRVDMKNLCCQVVRGEMDAEGNIDKDRVKQILRMRLQDRPATESRSEPPDFEIKRAAKTVRKERGIIFKLGRRRGVLPSSPRPNPQPTENSQPKVIEKKEDRGGSQGFFSTREIETCYRIAEQLSGFEDGERLLTLVSIFLESKKVGAK